MAKKKETNKTEDTVEKKESNDTETKKSTKKEDTFVTRMEDELKELHDKATKLNDFVHDNPKYNDLGRMEQALLHGQLKAMQTYEHMLKQRIKIYTEKA